MGVISDAEGKNMKTRSAQLVLFLFCSLPVATTAEVFVSDFSRRSILVYDNLDEGIDLPPKREIRGDATQLGVVAGLQIYTGSSPGSPTELFACNYEDGKLLAFPVDADGDVAPARVLQTDGCYAFLISLDEVFVSQAQGSIAVYDYQLEWDLTQAGGRAEPLREIVLGPPSLTGVPALAIANGELFVLVYDDVADETGVWVFDQFASGNAEDLIKRKILLDPLVEWGDLEVVGDEILLSILDSPVPNNALIPYSVISVDREADGVAPALRRLSSEWLGSSRMQAVGSELFIVTADLSGQADGGRYMVWDVRAGGIVEPKRTVSRSQTSFLAGAFALAVSTDSTDADTEFLLALEEPVQGATHSGVSNLRGWSISDEGIDKIEIYVDGRFFQVAPYGGSRGDVGAAFPDVEGSFESGFSLAYNYSVLDAGEHVIDAVAYTSSGRTQVASATFEVTRPGQEFIADQDAVDLNGASCLISNQSVVVKDILIEGRGPWDVFLNWQTASQGFEAQTYIFGNSSI